MLRGSVGFLCLTLGAYATGVLLQLIGRGHPLLNPTLIAIAIVTTVLLLLHVDYHTYFAAVQPIHLLLGPAVVALAVPLFRRAPLLRERALALSVALIVGSLTAIGSGIAFGAALHLPHGLVLSVAPKSATTAVSMEIAARLGGIPAITAVLTVLTGICGALIGEYVLKAMRIEDPAARGFSMGLTSHGIATAFNRRWSPRRPGITRLAGRRVRLARANVTSRTGGRGGSRRRSARWRRGCGDGSVPIADGPKPASTGRRIAVRPWN
jgi:putative effector of murein hydrolase